MLSWQSCPSNSIQALYSKKCPLSIPVTASQPAAPTLLWQVLLQPSRCDRRCCQFPPQLSRRLADTDAEQRLSPTAGIAPPERGGSREQRQGQSHWIRDNFFNTLLRYLERSFKKDPCLHSVLPDTVLWRRGRDSISLSPCALPQSPGKLSISRFYRQHSRSLSSPGMLPKHGMLWLSWAGEKCF